MDAEKAATLLLHEGGYGLCNVQQRIQLHCGEPYGISVESEVGGGTIIHVVIPIK